MPFESFQAVNPNQRIAQIYCERNETCKNIDIENKSFLLLIVLQGMAVFRTEKGELTVTAPAFVCFNEREKPVLIKKSKLKAMGLYFHPQFLNINMTFNLLRDKDYQDLASIHDLFLLTPFVQGSISLPVIDTYIPRVQEVFDEIAAQLNEQPDPYWSCRARSAFMNILMILETHYQMMLMGKLVVNHQPKEVTSLYVKKAVFYIETHYMDKITFQDIVAASGTNRTTLNQLFHEQLDETAMDYLKRYRVEIAQKQLRFTDVPLKEVAQQCGFATPEHFSRIFTEVMGTPPAAFRKESVEKRKHDFQVKAHG